MSTEPETTRKALFKRREWSWSGDQDGLGVSRRTVFVLLGWWLWMPITTLLWWAFISIFRPGVGTLHQTWHLFWVWFSAADGGVWGMSTWFWIWVLIGLISSLVIIGCLEHNNLSRGEIVLFMVIVLGAFASIYPIGAGLNDAAKDEAYFYLQKTTLYLENPDIPPPALSLMYSQTKGNGRLKWDGDTLYIGDPGRVKKGSLPADDYRKRNSSFDGAKKSLAQKTNVANGVNLMETTVTYAYSTTEAEDRWTGVLDGSGNVNPMAGVAEWRGGADGGAAACLFGTDPNYRFTRAFNGDNMNNLRNVIALAYPNLMYEDEDISGYCERKDRPVIVIAVTRYTGWRAEVQRVPAGVLELRGSPSGFPDIKYHPVVKPGEFPVPVYPISIARHQREMLDWLAGESNKENTGFGFEPPSFASQAGNNGEYVLKSNVSGRIVAYTPMTANASDSQLIINASLINVDEVYDGQLNPFSSYVLPQSPANGLPLVNLQTLDSIAQRLVMNTPNFSTFFTNGGRLKEYTPTGPNTFRVYAEDPNGFTVLYIDLRYNGSAQQRATVVTLAPGTGTELNRVEVSTDTTAPQTGTQTNGTTTVTCGGKDVKTASNEEVQACLKAYLDELSRRLKTGQATPAPSSDKPKPVPSAT